MKYAEINLIRKRFIKVVVTLSLFFFSLISINKSYGAETEVAALFTEVVSQGNWDPPGYQAFMAMATKYHYKPTYIENASYEKAPAILRSLASRGVKMIICHSSGYSAAIQEVAPDFPNTQFVLFSYADSVHDLKNYTAWSVDWDEYGYVVGALGAAASKSNHIAVIAGEQIPSAKRTVEFIERGAKAINPKTTVNTVYTGSFTDVAKAKEVAIGMLARGADVLIPSADTADTGTQQAAEEDGAKTMGIYMDQSAAFPDAMMTSTLINFNKAYDEMGAMLQNGTLGGKVITMDLANQGWTLQRPFKLVDSGVEQQVSALMDKVAKKEVSVE